MSKYLHVSVLATESDPSVAASEWSLLIWGQLNAIAEILIFKNYGLQQDFSLFLSFKLIN